MSRPSSPIAALGIVTFAFTLTIPPGASAIAGAAHERGSTGGADVLEVYERAAPEARAFVAGVHDTLDHTTVGTAPEPAARPAVRLAPPPAAPQRAPAAPAPVVAAVQRPPSGPATVIASWYGPGFYGNRTACGQLYTPQIVGVAHKTLPCGTLVEITFRAATVVVPVIDRGPFIPGRELDLSNATRALLACTDLCTVRMQVR